MTELGKYKPVSVTNIIKDKIEKAALSKFQVAISN
jgi:hypothetical protein